MEITIQQGVSDEGGIPRRNFKLKNGSYENSAYNDGGVPTHYIIVAWLQEPDTRKWDEDKKAWVDIPRPQKVQDYIDKFYPHWDKNFAQRSNSAFSSSFPYGAIILGEANSEKIECDLWEAPREDENPFIYLQEMAIKLAEEKGLIPEYTLLDIAECSPAVTLFGYKEGG